MEHPSQEVLLRFILGATSRQESRIVVRHLLARCPPCAAMLRRLRREPPLCPPMAPADYDQALDRLAETARELTPSPAPAHRPPVNANVAGEEDDLPQSSATSEDSAHRRWLFG